jgi:hypothetical protein
MSESDGPKQVDDPNYHSGILTIDAFDRKNCSTN